MCCFSQMKTEQHICTSILVVILIINIYLFYFIILIIITNEETYEFFDLILRQRCKAIGPDLMLLKSCTASPCDMSWQTWPFTASTSSPVDNNNLLINNYLYISQRAKIDKNNHLLVVCHLLQLVLLVICF